MLHKCFSSGVYPSKRFLPPQNNSSCHRKGFQPLTAPRNFSSKPQKEKSPPYRGIKQTSGAIERKHSILFGLHGNKQFSGFSLSAVSYSFMEMKILFAQTNLLQLLKQNRRFLERIEKIETLLLFQ